jgi:hypothetical protein
MRIFMIYSHCLKEIANDIIYITIFPALTKERDRFKHFNHIKLKLC